MYTNSKEFKFDSAHRLALGYVGKCSSLHGHSWLCTVFVKGETLDEYGMAIDFGDIKKAYKAWEIMLDHATFLHASDQELINVLLEMDTTLFVFEENPTSEVIARMLWIALSTALPKHCQLDRILINETCTSSCEFTLKPEQEPKPVIFKVLNARI